MSNSDAFKSRNYDQFAEECRAGAGAGAIARAEAILDHSPVLAAFEYWRLREELAAVHQLKDLAEVLMKLPVVVAAKLLILHGDDRQQAVARGLLVSRKPPSMGIWREAGLAIIRTPSNWTNGASPPDKRCWNSPSPWSHLAKSALWHQVGKLVPWRNRGSATAHCGWICKVLP